MRAFGKAECGWAARSRPERGRRRLANLWRGQLSGGGKDRRQRNTKLSQDRGCQIPSEHDSETYVALKPTIEQLGAGAGVPFYSGAPARRSASSRKGKSMRIKFKGQGAVRDVPAIRRWIAVAKNISSSFSIERRRFPESIQRCNSTPKVAGGPTITSTGGRDGKFPLQGLLQGRAGPRAMRPDLLTAWIGGQTSCFHARADKCGAASRQGSVTSFFSSGEHTEEAPPAEPARRRERSRTRGAPAAQTPLRGGWPSRRDPLAEEEPEKCRAPLAPLASPGAAQSPASDR